MLSRRRAVVAGRAFEREHVEPEQEARYEADAWEDFDRHPPEMPEPHHRERGERDRLLWGWPRRASVPQHSGGWQRRWSRCGWTRGPRGGVKRWWVPAWRDPRTCHATTQSVTRMGHCDACGVKTPEGRGRGEIRLYRKSVTVRRRWELPCGRWRGLAGRCRTVRDLKCGSTADGRARRL